MSWLRWRKVLRDLRGNLPRTLLVVLSVTLGVVAVTMTLGAQSLLSAAVREQYAASGPASAVIITDAFDDELVRSVARMPGVGLAEGRRSVMVRASAGPDTWRDLQLLAIGDYNDIRIQKLAPWAGAWPPPKRTLLLERSALGFIPGQVGQPLLIKLADGTQRQVPLAGLTHDLAQLPPLFSNRATGYVSLDTLPWLGEPQQFNQLAIVLAAGADDKAQIKRVVSAIEDRLRKSGHTVYGTQIPEPNKHPAGDIVQALLLLLSVIGVVVLLMSGFLVTTMIAALLAQHTRQIGVLKALGARTRHVVTLYGAMVLCIGALAVIIGLPLGAAGANGLALVVGQMFNFNQGQAALPAYVTLVGVCAGLIVPLGAALWPVLRGAGITVRDAITDYGVQSRAPAGWLSRVGERLQLRSRPLLLAQRNVFRRKGRLALTLAALTLSGGLFMAIISVHASLQQTLNDTFTYYGSDVWIFLQQPRRLAQLEPALRVSGVTAVEGWGYAPTRIVRADASESDTVTVVAPPSDTTIFRPTLVRGRWLLPDDENALVVSTQVLQKEPDLDVGDTVVLKLNARETTWTIVGVVQTLLHDPRVYADYDYYAYITGNSGAASWIHLTTSGHDMAAHNQVAQALNSSLDSANARVDRLMTMSLFRMSNESQFGIIVVFLLLMVLLLATVGGMGLAGMMSINVLERTREIGVLRAVGASSTAIFGLIVAEAVLVGLCSWMLGVVLAWPLSKLMSDAVGLAFVQAPLNSTFAPAGTLIWLVLVVLLATIASLLPARAAVRLTVRAVLAYE